MERIRRKKRLTKKAKKLIVGVLAAFVLLGVIAALIPTLRACKLSSSKRELPFAADANYCYTGDGFMYASGGELRYMSLTDEKKNFSVAAETENARLIGTELVKAVYGASSVQIVGTPFDNRVEGGIIKAAAGGKYVGVYVENADNTRSLIVYNSAGSQSYRVDYPSGVLLDFGFEGGASSVVYTTEISTLGGAVATTITTYDLARESKTGVLNVRDQAVKNVIFTKKSVFAFGTDSVIRFDRSTNEEAYRVLCRGYDLKSSACSGSDVYLMLEPSVEENAPVRVLRLKEAGAPGDAAAEFPSSTGALNAFMMGARVVIVGENSMDVYSFDGKKEKSIPLDGVDSAKKLDDKNILVTRAGGATLYTFK